MVSLATTSRTPALKATPALPLSKMRTASSPVPILKTSKPAPAVGSKRKMSDADLTLSPSSSQEDDVEDTQPTKKKARVQFDREVKMHEDTSSETSLAVVREEVRGAIHRHVAMSESEGYDRIKGIFTADPKEQGDDALLAYDMPTHTCLKNHLLGLLSHVASLDRSCSGLVNAIISSEWVGRDESYVKLYIRFLGNLAAAQNSYLGSVLKMLVSNMTIVPRGVGRLPGYAVVSASEIHTRVHMALRHVLRLIPAGSGALSPILSAQFPSDADPASANITYTRNLIQMIAYAPELQSDIFGLITEKLVKIDVQIQVDMEDFEDEVGDDLLHEANEEDDEDDDVSVASGDSEEDDTKAAKKIKENISKVDGMIDLLFEYFSVPFANGSLTDKENALDLLLSNFKSIILPTYRSRHSQFLLFHFSQMSPALVDRFAATFIQHIFNKLQSAIIRQSSAAYLASFVARGAHIAPEVVRDVFDLLLTHLDSLRVDYEKTCRGPDLRRYGPFYSTAQAILYIFCFRWRELTTAAAEGDTPDQVDELEPNQIAFPPNVKEFLHKCIYSRLNPLKVCSPAIVAEFARITHHFQFLYVYPLLETNKRIRITAFRSISTLADPRFSHVGREIHAGDNGGYQLDAYFPFDPYQLPRSRRWLEGDYVEWRGIPGLDDADDSDSGAEGSDDESDGEDVTETDEE
ncbi:RNA polymerase I specific transcription initiation factor RRN3 [Penicillium soppii]|uniref:RNA polymerase I specific transcription initiation factor RRN3 n=1 Tax=Penicillium soppii TaxID=69789 RepID=UPI00254942E2|nr:RNA polymerase I specific transcription initiation factor RRN3 [Penicillium soppii]KAJ5865023.1 RNA polymerase I specific transcription initiation factor RRN3 [Penicillium soppii]